MVNFDMPIGERCGDCVLSMRQPWCEKLNRQLPTIPGNVPLTPPDCPIKESVDSNCVIVNDPEVVSEPE